jgi:hypothetical protein
VGAGAVRRIDVPSGGWWEVETRPLWRHVREWREGAHHNDGGLVDRVVVSLTTAWSFDLPVELDSLALVDADDVGVVLEVLVEQVAKLSGLVERKTIAEELFARMAAGSVPEEFAEVHVLAVAGWSWRELQETPADVVERMAIYKAVAETMSTGGTLDFGGSSIG